MWVSRALGAQALQTTAVATLANREDEPHCEPSRVQAIEYRVPTAKPEDLHLTRVAERSGVNSYLLHVSTNSGIFLFRAEKPLQSSGVSKVSILDNSYSIPDNTMVTCW